MIKISVHSISGVKDECLGVIALAELSKWGALCVCVCVCVCVFTQLCGLTMTSLLASHSW